MTGFILTMWYLKVFPTPCPERTLTCFILTMWYLKLTHECIIVDKLLKFYINYVVFKVAYQEDFSLLSLCFILTMWYLKNRSWIYICIFGSVVYIKYVVFKPA